jgi:hypothetical protein
MMQWLAANQQTIITTMVSLSLIVGLVVRILHKLGVIHKERADALTEVVEDIAEDVVSSISVMPSTKTGLRGLIENSVKNLAREKMATRRASVQRANDDAAARVDPKPEKQPRRVGAVVRDVLLDAVIPWR